MTETDSIMLWMYVQLLNHKHHLQIRFIELIEKDTINLQSGIHYITEDRKEHFIIDKLDK